jgi:hypothetical protein
MPSLGEARNADGRAAVTGDWYYLRVEVVLSPREGSGAPFFLTRECRELSSLLFVFQVTADDLGDVRVLFSLLLY